MVQGGVSPEDWSLQDLLADRYPGRIHATYGIHPVWAASKSQAEIEAALDQLEARSGAALAIGEIGLDHSPKAAPDSRELQHWAFKKQLELVQRVRKPMILHIVRAHGEALKLLSSMGPWPEGGLVHSYSGSVEEVREYCELGFHLSVSGVVTRDGYKALKAAVPVIPGERLILETDCPDQAPRGWQAALNEPAALIQVAQAVGAIRNEPAEKLLDQSTQNLIHLFKIHGAAK